MKYGCKKDSFDHRDFLRVEPYSTKALPEIVDLRPKCPPVLNQLELGSCTANAIANAHYYQQLIQPGGIDSLPSRLAIYYMERVIEGTVYEDSGAQIRDGFKAIAKNGVPPESSWPYDINRFTEQPPPSLVTESLKHRITSYQRVVPHTQSLKAILATNEPVVIGIEIYDSFETDSVTKTGIVPVPDTTKEKLIGGHAVLIVGYDDTKRSFIVMNSWGTEWGDKGYFYLPYTYADNGLISDSWTIKTVLEE